MPFDPFLLWTPILLLGIFGLVRFIGCQFFLDFTPDNPPPPVVKVNNLLVLGQAFVCGTVQIRINGVGLDDAEVKWNGRLFKTTGTATQREVTLPVTDSTQSSVQITVLSPSGMDIDGGSQTLGISINPGTPDEVTFERLDDGATGIEGPVPAQIKAIKLNPGSWKWRKHADGTVDISLRSGSEGAFSFDSPRIFAGIDAFVYSGTQTSTVALSDDGLQQSPAPTQFGIAVRSYQEKSIPVSWSKCSTTITVKVTCADPSAELFIRRIRYREPR